MKESAPELLAPAGDWECLRAAVASGADAVYFGLPKFNARLRAENFQSDDLPEVMKFLHAHGVKGFVTFNTLVFTGELTEAVEQLQLLERCGVDAIIVQDLGLARLAKELTPGLNVHASTQMTITSPEGAAFAAELGAKRVVLARELSLREIEKFQGAGSPPLEVFVHGALCVAYSGQCLTSEALGQRSANRGECAQACRMPYQLIVDGVLRDLGDRRYLLSPQDLAAIDEIPELIRRGVASFKIEGRLKSPEYVAAVTQVYRKSIDAALARQPRTAPEEDRYQLEMTFSRGLFSGWMHGVNHQRLVPARFGKKRGPFAGRISRVGADHVAVEMESPLKRGDGIVFDTGDDPDREQGGRIYDIRGDRLFFQHDRIDFRRINIGDRVWKTGDPALNERLRRTWRGALTGRSAEALHLEVWGQVGEKMSILGRTSGSPIVVTSKTDLLAARTAPLTIEKLRAHLGRLGGTRYTLASLDNRLEGELMLPIAELNRIRRRLVEALDAPSTPAPAKSSLDAILGEIKSPPGTARAPELTVLCRTMDQLAAASECGVARIYADFEDIRRYNEAVTAKNGTPIFLATPRIQKAGEHGFFNLIESTAPDGVLVRNLGAIRHFAEAGIPMIGDFSLNVANPVTALHLVERGVPKLTISYDLNIEQVLELLRSAPPAWFELTLHQHIPMFHMEHCVFAAFMSDGTDYTNCGRPCEKHRVHLRDRVGIEHPLRADVGCRNTLFNATPQTGASFFDELRATDLGSFRVELLEESPDEARRVIAAYQSLLKGGTTGGDLWRSLRAQSQLGVTRGTY